jgi:hypothetical protein
MVQIPMINLSPSFAAIGKKLVFAMTSMDVKNELKRVHGGEGEAIVAGFNPLNAPGFKLPAEARSVLVMDWAKLLGSILDTLKAFAPMLGDGLPVDLTKLPPGSIFAEFFKPTFHYAKGTPSGLYRRNEASFGPETWFGLFGAAYAAGAQRALGGAGPAEGVVPLPVPDETGSGGG